MDPEHYPTVSRSAVLVVEDEPAIGAFVRRVLNDRDVTLVTRATEALELLRTGKQFDVIISDVSMPEMSGVEFYDQLVEHHPAIVARVIFLTGGVLTAATQSLFERVSNQIVKKPFHPQHLKETVNRVSASRSGGSQP